MEIRRADVKKLIKKIDKFYDLEVEDQIVVYTYYIVNISGDDYVNEDDIKKCCQAIDLPVPRDIKKKIFSKLIKKKRCVLHGSGIRLAGPESDNFNKKFFKSRIQTKIKGRDLSLFLILDKDINSVSKNLFLDGYYSQSIFEAVKVLEKEIKKKSGVNKIGVGLINHVFNKDNPILSLVDGEELEEVDEREGFRFLFMGTFLGIKNPKSHSIQQLNDPSRALEYLSFISLLLKRIKESKKLA